MNIKAQPFQAKAFQSELFVVFSAPFDTKTVQKHPSFLASHLDQIRNFSGKKYDSLLVALPGNPIQNLLLIGTGDQEGPDAALYRESGAAITRVIQQIKPRQLDIYCQSSGETNDTLIDAIISGYYRASYRYEKSKNQKKYYHIDRLVIHMEDQNSQKNLNKMAKDAAILGNAVNYARDLANTPANMLTPRQFASTIRSTFKSHKNVALQIYQSQKLAEMGMHALLSVARGSFEKPVLIQMKYKTTYAKAKTIALVGKGVTFDSGGISIKPAARMEEMKYDMAGGAAVAGLLLWAAQTKPRINIVGIIPAAENLPGQRALKPGDVVHAYDGTSIEVINTDAEGRLLLADALAFVQKKHKPDWIVDLATLTGSIVVALGSHASGMFGSDDHFIDHMKTAAECCGERVWRMPLWDDYSKELESDVADIKNVGGRGGGSITAAKFLHQFVKTKSWIHLDIAGTAYKQKSAPNAQKGATGVGVRLLAYLIRTLSS